MNNKLQADKSTANTNGKKWLIVGASVLGATTITFASLFTWKCLTASEGGNVYKPGTEVEMKAEIDDPTGGQYKVTFDDEGKKAVVGEKYHGTITLTPKNEVTQECYLPEKLVSVISNTTVLEKENYTYTLGETCMTATLEIPANYVFGPVVINLALVTPSEPGPGPEPEPVVWEDATQEEALASRNNAQAQHFGKNPFIFLSTLEGEGTQYRITITKEEASHMSNAINTNTVTYEIDTSAFYIKRVVEEDEVQVNLNYYTCRESEDTAGYYSLYQCYYSGSPTHNTRYTMPTYDMVYEYFTVENDTIGDKVYEMYGSEYYEYEGTDKLRDDLLVTIEDYQDLFDEIGTEAPMTYKKGNSTSFKVINETQTEYEGMNIEGKFDFTMQNSQLVKYRKSIIAKNQGGAEIENFHDVFEFKAERATFTLDDLDPFFAE